jgi:hypothetical protein
MGERKRGRGGGGAVMGREEEERSTRASGF